VVIARDALECLIGNRRTLDEPDLGTELAEAPAFDFHALRVVVRLTQIFTEGMAEYLACPNGHHDPPPRTPLGLTKHEVEQPKQRIIRSDQPTKNNKTAEPNFPREPTHQNKTEKTSTNHQIERLTESQSFNEAN